MVRAQCRGLCLIALHTLPPLHVFFVALFVSSGGLTIVFDVCHLTPTRPSPLYLLRRCLRLQWWFATCCRCVPPQHWMLTSPTRTTGFDDSALRRIECCIVWKRLLCSKKRRSKLSTRRLKLGREDQMEMVAFDCRNRGQIVR